MGLGTDWLPEGVFRAKCPLGCARGNRVVLHGTRSGHPWGLDHPFLTDDGPVQHHPVPLGQVVRGTMRFIGGLGTR